MTENWVRSVTASMTIEVVGSAFKRIIIDAGILRLLSKPHTIELLDKTYVLNNS